MSSTFEDSVFGFDLNFLTLTPQSSNTTLGIANKNNDVIIENWLRRKNRQIKAVKHKIIATDMLVGKFLVTKREFRETDKNLSASKEECKRICIDYYNAMQKCSKLEADAVTFQNTIKQLEERCYNLQNECEALKSHINQLQALINEFKVKNELLGTEKKPVKVDARKYDKKILLLQKERDTILKHTRLFSDIISGKKKLNSKYKSLLRKYETESIKKKCDKSLLADENNESEDDIFDDVLSPYNDHNLTQNKANANGKAPGNDKHATPVELDNDCSNEIVSVDTGRGSSLASSDIEKCFPSPDYYIDDSPLSKETDQNKVNVKHVTIATSPLPLITTVEVATSPITVLQDESVLLHIILDDKNEEQTEKSHSHKSTIDKSVSPIHFNVNKSVSTSPVRFENKLVETYPLEVANEIQNEEQPLAAEKECLEKNNSDNYLHENNNDCEIETILKSMRFNYNLLTPIPSTPACSTRVIESDIVNETINQNEKIEHSKDYVCKKADLVGERVEKCDEKIDNIAKELAYVKNLLKNLLFSNKIDLKDYIHVLSSGVNNKEIKTVCNDVDFSFPIHNMVNSYSTKEDSRAHKKIHSFSSYDLFGNDDTNDVNYDDIPSIPTPCNVNPNDVDTTIHKNVDNILPRDLFDDETIELNIDETENVIRVNDEYVNDVLEEDPIIIPNIDSLSDKSLQVPISQQKEIASDPDLLQYTQILEPNKVISDNDLIKEILNNNKSPKIILEKLQFENKNSSSPNCKKYLTFEKDVLHEVKKVKTSPVSNNSIKKNKSKKISRLQKIKKKLEPTYKIKSESKQCPKKLRLKPKPLNLTNQIVKVTESKTSASLNDKNIYENAVKVMAEIRAKQVSSTKCSKVVSIVKKNETHENANKTAPENLSTSLSSTSTRSRKRSLVEGLEQINSKSETLTKEIQISNNSTMISSNVEMDDDDYIPISSLRILRKRKRRDDTTKIQCKRTLRSSTIHQQIKNINTEPNKDIENNTELKLHTKVMKVNVKQNQATKTSTQNIAAGQSEPQQSEHSTLVTYEDLDMFSNVNEPQPQRNFREMNTRKKNYVQLKESILGVMLQKYGVQTVKTSIKKISDTSVKAINEKFENEIAKIIELPRNETKNAMNMLVADLQKLDHKHFITGLLKYLTSPERKTELFGKVYAPPAPPMTKSEQVLLYVITKLRNCWPSIDIADAILCNIEYTLFKLNRTPSFDVIETVSHFYAVLCRYFNAKSRLRLFILDAMYCIQFKSVVLIKQCLDVWMHIIPLAHMGIAKSPLVMCLVYLLHFYKCEDKFNRVQEIRNILDRKYFYKISEWNETKILEMIRNSIKELKDIPIEKKMLRLAIIILAKRHGFKWCQNQIITNMLQPMIYKNDVPDNVKEFCVSLIGPLMKPYSADMKVHCEVAINQLMDIWKKNPSKGLEEAVIASLLCMTKHNKNDITRALVSRKMTNFSPDLEDALRDYVREKPLKVWKGIITKMKFK